MTSLIERATANLSDILRDALLVEPTEHQLVIYDTESPLTKILTDAYRAALPSADFLEFETETAEQILERINALKPKDAVILVQSTNFRLNEFRLRIELFKRDLKTIEHLHLGRLTEDQFENYINSLEYNKDYYRGRGAALKRALDESTEVVVECNGTKLVFQGGTEDAKLNVGDYREMKNVGGTYPIGEVFTEAKNLELVNGDAMIFSYAGEDHRVRIVEPFRVVVEKGILTAPEGAPEEFQRILELIRAEEDVLVRELGLGLNKALGKHALVSDITAFERQNGVHLSLGEKHAVYAKPELHRRKGRYHIDIFVDVTRITADGVVLYENGDYVV